MKQSRMDRCGRIPERDTAKIVLRLAQERGGTSRCTAPVHAPVGAIWIVGQAHAWVRRVPWHPIPSRPPSAHRALSMGPQRRPGRFSRRRRFAGAGGLRLMTGPAHRKDGSTDVPLVPFLRRRKWHSPPRPAQPWIGADFTGFRGCGGAFFKISLQKKWHTPPGLCFRGFWPLRRGFVPLVPLFLNFLLHAHAPAHASSDVEKKWHKWHTALKRAVCLEIPRKTPVPLLRTEVAQAFR